MIKKLVVTALAAVSLGLVSSGTVQASTIHTVLPGESLWRISSQRQMPLDVIRRNNSLSSDTLHVGQFLRIPDRYVVKSGDTLWQISQRYGIPLSTVQRVNNDWSGSLQTGQVLYLPTPLRNVVSLSAADRDLFERLVSAEAKGEPFNGQVAVAAVVLNRVKSSQFPGDVRSVIMQRYGSIPAFSPVTNGEIYKPATVASKEAVRVALQGYDHSLGSLFFYNSKLTSADNWIRSRAITMVIGNHTFAR